MRVMDTNSWVAVAALAVSGFSAIFSGFAWLATRRQAESAERALALEVARRDDELSSARAAALLAGSADITVRLLQVEQNTTRKVVIANIGMACAKGLRLQVLPNEARNGPAPSTEHRWEDPQDLLPGASYTLPVVIASINFSRAAPLFTVSGHWRDIRGEMSREWEIREHPETDSLCW